MITTTVTMTNKVANSAKDMQKSILCNVNYCSSYAKHNGGSLKAKNRTTR